MAYYEPLTRRDDHMVLPCEGLKVRSVASEYGWTFEFEPHGADPWVLRLSGSVAVTQPDGQKKIEIDTDEEPRKRPPHDFEHCRMTEASVWRNGRLRLAFSDGAQIEMEPDDRYETWTLNRKDAPSADAFVSPIAPAEKDWS